VLGATNSYSGGTTVVGGTLSISSSGNLGNGGTLALENGTTLNYAAGGTYSGHPITVAGDPFFNVGSGLTVNENDQITDGDTPGTVEKTGAGTLVLGAANSYSGGTTVSGGTVQVGNDSALGTGGVDLATSGTTLDLNGHSVTIGDLAGVTGSQVTLGSSNLTTGGDGATTSFAGTLTGSGGLIKAGSGTFTLSGFNSGFSGDTTVAGGTLSISSSGNLGTGTTLALENGTTLNYGANGFYGTNTHVITVAGDPSFNVASGLFVTEASQITDGTTPGSVEVTGGGTLELINSANSYSGGTTVTGNSTLLVETDSHMGAASGGLTLGDATSGGTLETFVSFTSGRKVTLGAGGGTFEVDNNTLPPSTTTLTLQGVISGDGS
jgi:autotransporter-associated beta strand protein